MPLSFPLYHGTSSHYLEHFNEGSAPIKDTWPHKTNLLMFLEDIKHAVPSGKLDPIAENMLAQRSDAGNWQHGDFYVTPSEISAVRYANANATYGGELLTATKSSFDQLNAISPSTADEIFSKYKSLHPFFLSEGRPVLLRINNVEIHDLDPEQQQGSTDFSNNVIALVEDIEKLISLGIPQGIQQHNFRLKPGRGNIYEMFEAVMHNPMDPLSEYTLSKLRH